MEWAEIQKWLKETIPGIVLLGALGSIVAVGLLKFASKIFKDHAKILFTKGVEKYLKPALIQRVILKKLKKDNYVYVIVYVVFSTFIVIIASFVFIVFLLATITYFVIKGPYLTSTSISLVILTILSLFAALRRALSYFVLYLEEIDLRIADAVREAKKLPYKEIIQYITKI